MNDALFNLALAAIGLPVVVLAVFLVARHLVYRHANATADAIRKQHPQPVPAQGTAFRMRQTSHDTYAVELAYEDDEYEYALEFEVEATHR